MSFKAILAGAGSGAVIGLPGGPVGAFIGGLVGAMIGGVFSGPTGDVAPLPTTATPVDLPPSVGEVTGGGSTPISVGDTLPIEPLPPYLPLEPVRPYPSDSPPTTSQPATPTVVVASGGGIRSYARQGSVEAHNSTPRVVAPQPGWWVPRKPADVTAAPTPQVPDLRVVETNPGVFPVINGHVAVAPSSTDPNPSSGRQASGDIAPVTRTVAPIRLTTSSSVAVGVSRAPPPPPPPPPRVTPPRPVWPTRSTGTNPHSRS